MPHGTPPASSSPVLGSELCTTVPGHMMCIRRDHHSAHFADPRVTLGSGCASSVSVVLDDCSGRFSIADARRFTFESDGSDVYRLEGSSSKFGTSREEAEEWIWTQSILHIRHVFPHPSLSMSLPSRGDSHVHFRSLNWNDQPQCIVITKTQSQSFMCLLYLSLGFCEPSSSPAQVENLRNKDMEGACMSPRGNRLTRTIHLTWNSVAR